MVSFGALPYHFERGRWGSGGPPPGNFEILTLKQCILEALPYHFEGVGGGRGAGGHPRKFWIFNLEMVHFGGSSIWYWQIKGFATGSKYLLQLKYLLWFAPSPFSEQVPWSKFWVLWSTKFAPTLPLDNLAAFFLQTCSLYFKQVPGLTVYKKNCVL